MVFKDVRDVTAAVYTSFADLGFEAVVLGGNAAALYGFRKSTDDIDLFVDTSFFKEPDNYDRLASSLQEKGLGFHKNGPLFSLQDSTGKKYTIDFRPAVDYIKDPFSQAIPVSYKDTTMNVIRPSSFLVNKLGMKAKGRDQGSNDKYDAIAIVLQDHEEMDLSEIPETLALLENPKNRSIIINQLEWLAGYLSSSTRKGIVSSMDEREYRLTPKGRKAILESDPDEVSDQLKEVVQECTDFSF